MIKYILVFETTTEESSKFVRAFIKANRFIDEWSFLFTGAYFLKSKYSLREIDDSFDEFFRPARYVVAKISDVNEMTDGVLSPGIWSWLREDEPSDIQNLLG